MTFVLDLNDTPHLWYRRKGRTGGGGGRSSNVVGIICQLVEIGLTDLSKSWGVRPSPRPPSSDSSFNNRRQEVENSSTYLGALNCLL